MKYFTLLSILFATLFISSCGESDVAGCTDPFAANFNPAANVDSGDCQYLGCNDEDADNFSATSTSDDGSCTYFDRFVGTYAGTFVCMATFADLLDEASAEITKKDGDDNQDEITVVVSNPATAITLLLDGKITKDEAIIDTYIENFEYELEVGGLVIEGPFEVFVTGTLTRSADESLSGDINIRIVKDALAVADTCTYTASK